MNRSLRSFPLLLALSAAACSASPGDGAGSTSGAVSARSSSDLTAFVKGAERDIVAKASAGAPLALQALDVRTLKCLGQGSGPDLRGACTVQGDYAAPNSSTTFAVVVHRTGADAAYTVTPLTGEDVEPEGGHAEGSAETLLVDGGGEDAVHDQLVQKGLTVDAVIGEGDDLHCLEADGPTPLGVCLLKVKLADGSRLPVAVTISEEDGGSPEIVKVVRLAGEGPTDDAAITSALRAAIGGLETGGGEGDPDPYKLATAELAPGEKLTGDALLQKLLPSLEGFEGTDDVIPGHDRSNLRDFWRGATRTPVREDFEDDASFEAGKVAAGKWRKVKAIVESTLVNVQYYHLGYRSYPEGSLETGPVALTLVGRTPRGTLVALYGIVIWT